MPHAKPLQKAFTYRQNGFTLVELSIALAIIGLLIGALLMSSDLLRASKMLEIVAQVDEFNKAIGVFKQKYKDLPGDMPNAESFWGSDTSCPSTPYNALDHIPTCNGDGSSTIGNYYVDGGTTSYESFRAWQQLSNAGMLTGSYSGTAGSGGSLNAMPNINAPNGPLSGTGFSLLYIFLPNGNTDYWPMLYGHAYIYGTSTTTFTNGPALTPSEAYLVDQKIDDAKPATGILVTNKSSIVPNCTTSDTQTISAYNVTFKSNACDLIFISGF